MMFLIPHLHAVIKYAIFKITRGKPQAATLLILTAIIINSRQLFAVVGGYLRFPLKIS